MKVVVKHWGNRAAAARPLGVRKSAGRIVTKPIRKKLFDLHDLVTDITDENRHDLIASARYEVFKTISEQTPEDVTRAKAGA